MDGQTAGVYRFKTKPYDHQIRYLRSAQGRRAYALFADMGLGKSKMDVDETAMLWEAGEVDTWLVTSAKGNYATWVGEIARHMPTWVPVMVHMWDGSDSARAREERRALLAHQGLAVLVINIEALASSTRARELARRVLGRSKRRKITVDESTLIKNHEAIRTNELCTLSRVAEYRRILTGNPTPNTPMDLWGQFLFLGQGAGDMLGFRSFYAFRARYAILQQQHVGNGRTVQVPVAFRNLDELSRTVGAHSFRVTKEECLDLPPKVYEIRRVEMSADQRRVYEQLKRQAWSKLDEEGSTTSASMVVAQMVKMHQVLCGQVIDDDGKVQELANGRIQALLDTVEESGRATVVWCAYRSNVTAVCRELRRSYGDSAVVEYHGGVHPTQRAEAIERFQSGAAHFFVGTPHAGGRGITLTAAKCVVYYSNSYDLELRLQSEDRAHRIGTTGSVTYVDLLIPGTLDQKIVEALRKKINISSQIMAEGPKSWLI